MIVHYEVSMTSAAAPSVAPYQHRIVSDADPTSATPDEIWRREYLTCGALTHEARVVYADRAKALEEAKATMRNQSAIEIAAKAPSNVTRRVDLPANAEELRAAVLAEALRTFSISADEFDDQENVRARWFALVALTHIPEANHHHCLRGRLGPTRAKLILRLVRGGSIDWENKMRARWPGEHRKAVRLGATLRAVWGADAVGRAE